MTRSEKAVRAVFALVGLLFVASLFVSFSNSAQNDALRARPTLSQVATGYGKPLSNAETVQDELPQYSADQLPLAELEGGRLERKDTKLDGAKTEATKLEELAQGEVPTPESAEPTDVPKTAPYPANHDGSTMHIVYSVACTQQHRLLFSTMLQISATRVGQKGPITMIVSGCKEEEKVKVLSEPRFYYDFRVHFTQYYMPHPEPGIDDYYPPYNKPYALRHFLHNAQPPVQHETLALIDSDFFFFNKLEVNTGRNMTRYYKGKERDPATVTDEVRDGVAVAHDWRRTIEGDKFFDTNMSEAVCRGRNCASIPSNEAWEYYWGLGPPYIMTRNDWFRFMDGYCLFTVEARKVSPMWTAEMHGYSFAAAELGIKHTILTHLGITHPFQRDTNEYWAALNGEGDEQGIGVESAENPCLDPIKVSVPDDPPVAIHYIHWLCNGDKGSMCFQKSKVPNDIIKCEHPLMKIPDPKHWDEVTAKAKKDRMRTYKRAEIWASCSLLKGVNIAATALKEATCGKDGYNAYRSFEIRSG